MKLISMKINFVLLRKIIKWNAEAEIAKLTLNKSVDDLARVDDASAEITDNNDNHRRLQDTFTKGHPKRKMNLDRRSVSSDRRVDVHDHYRGKARRYTIDRRLNLKDRRENV
jgi:hypothetical protein